MSLNETQNEYIEEVRAGGRSDSDVLGQLAEVDVEAYENANFREMLFALDSLNRFEGKDWSKIFVRGIVKYSGWIENRILKPKAFLEIGGYREEYGSGEYGVGLVLDLVAESITKPVNHKSFRRRVFKNHFNGIQPVSDNALFLIKRYAKSLDSLSLEDIDLFFHILEETKGLANDAKFDRQFAVSVRDACFSADGVVDQKVMRLVQTRLEVADECVNAEKLLIRKLVDGGVKLNTAVLRKIDMSMDRLAGMA